MKGFLVVSTILNWFWCIKWSSKDIPNVLVKMMWFGLAVWGSWMIVR